MIKDFIYLRPGNLKEALQMLSDHQEECKVIAGGQSLLILMRQGLVTPKYLIDIKNLNELNYIRIDSNEGLKIGATTTHRSIEKSPLIRERFTILSEMERGLASIQTRNWGTIGGNLCHGEPAGDPAPVLIALGAKLKMASSTNERIMDMEDFSLDYFETALYKNELLLEIQIPFLPPRLAIAFEKFTIIQNDMAISSVASSVSLDDDGYSLKDVRIVLGGVAPIPKRVKKVEEMLVGKRLSDDLIEKVSKVASEEAEPISDIHASEDYRRELVNVLTKRTLRKAWERARSLV